MLKLVAQHQKSTIKYGVLLLLLSASNKLVRLCGLAQMGKHIRSKKDDCSKENVDPLGQCYVGDVHRILWIVTKYVLGKMGLCQGEQGTVKVDFPR